MVVEQALARADVNVALLTAELRAACSPNFAGLNKNTQGVFAVFETTPGADDLTALETTVTAHDAAALTDAQKTAQAAAAALGQGKVYLRKQLLNPTPDVTAIYDTVKAQVEGNAHLARMVANQQALVEAAHGWTLDLTTPTAQDRARYLLIIEQVIALLT